MGLTDLANELLLQIFCSCDAIKDALKLGATCHRLRTVSHSSNRLPILYAVAEAQLGPIHDAIRLVTHNASQPVHIPRPAPPQSLALIQNLLTVGRIANKIVLLYPAQKWRGASSSSRRLLSSNEAYRLRRAIYRLWLYSKAFHTPCYMGPTRLQPPVVRSRAAVLRPFPASELAELLDAHAILRVLIAYHICPSEETVRRRDKARYHHDSYRIPPTVAPSKSTSTSWLEREYQTRFHHSSPQMSLHSLKLEDASCWATAAPGWGDEITHYYIVEDMLKLPPDQIIWLYEHLSGAPGTTASKEDSNAWLTMCNALTWLSKKVQEGHFAGPDEQVVNGVVDVMTEEWFENNGETVGETVDFVVEERGEEKRALREQVAEGELGVVTGASL